jgi:phenylpropionate dioxygenase-like ring-hydroxylating dioxygenase large terminal subunit
VDFEVSVAPVSTARSLPPAVYTSDAFYEFEREAIFGREWFCVGRAEQIAAPGDYLTITIAGEPLVAVRKSDGSISVLSAVCQHRGSLIAHGSGSCGSYLRCPYHWWTYDLDGKLVTAPQMHRAEGFDRDDHHLPTLRVEQWEGFVFACFDAGTSPLGPRLAPLADYLAGYRLADLRTTEPVVSTDHPFNWKLMVENGIEPYHATYLHHGQFEAPKERNYDTFDVESGDAVVSVVNHGFVDASLNPTYRPYFPVIETLSDEARRRFGFATVLPNLMLGWQSDMVFWFLVLPTSAASIDMRWGYLVPPSTQQLPVFDQLLELTHTGIEGYNAQDLPMAEMMQIGLGSRFAPRGRYSHEEEVLTRVNRWLLERYRRADDAAAAVDTPVTVR